MRACLRNVILVALLVPVAFCEAHPFAGTWRLNLVKSKDASPARLPLSETLYIEERDGSMKLTADQVYPQEKPLHVEYDVRYDGKDYPVKGSPTGDTVALRRINANTLETRRKRDGKLLFTFVTVISQDGKTRTSTFAGKNAKGERISWVAVFDKQ